MALSFCHYLRKWRPRFVILTSPTRLTNEICGCSSMARVPAFQAGYAGSIPVTRSIDSKMTPSLRGVILLSMHWSLESGGAQRRLPSPRSFQSGGAQRRLPSRRELRQRSHETSKCYRHHPPVNDNNISRARVISTTIGKQPVSINQTRAFLERRQSFTSLINGFRGNPQS